MVVFLCKSLTQIGSRDSRTHLYIFQYLYIKSFSQISESTNPQSFIVDYLLNSCGLSLKRALFTAKRIDTDFKTREKPDSVLRFLETNGFSKTQIAKVISVRPQILTAKLDETLKPKIKQLQDLGLSSSELARLIATDPVILSRRIQCNIEFIRSFVGSDKNVIKAVKNNRWRSLLSGNLKWFMTPNIALLRDYNVPDSRIAYLIMNKANSLMQKPESLKETVENLRRLGFKPESGIFSVGIYAMYSISKSTWDAKIRFLKDLGWSEDEIFCAFRKMPVFLMVSTKKIKQGMDFFAKMLNWNASIISNNPMFLMFSLKKRVIPRFTIYQILKSKELVKEESELIAMLRVSEKVFLNKYITMYQDELPDLVMTYKAERINDITAILVAK